MLNLTWVHSQSFLITIKKLQQLLATTIIKKRPLRIEYLEDYYYELTAFETSNNLYLQLFWLKKSIDIYRKHLVDYKKFATIFVFFIILFFIIQNCYVTPV